jgi:predicted Rossmann fold nucleotide-binding protein DprA/Smf involved in DNA uptake
MLRSLMLLNKCMCYDVRFWERFEALGLPPEDFMGSPSIWERLGVTERNISVMSKAISSGWADRELEACEKKGVRIVTCRDAVFPHSLSQLPDAPCLYI